MKAIFRSMLGLCLSVGFLAAATSDSMRVTFAQPVDVAGTTLPAGTYLVRNMSTTSTPVLQFRGDKGVAASVIVESLGVQSGTGTKLVLKEVNNKMEVEQIWFADEGGFEILPSSAK